MVERRGGGGTQGAKRGRGVRRSYCVSVPTHQHPHHELLNRCARQKTGIFHHYFADQCVGSLRLVLDCAGDGVKAVHLPHAVASRSQREGLPDVTSRRGAAEASVVRSSSAAGTGARFLASRASSWSLWGGRQVTRVARAIRTDQLHLIE